MFLIILQQGIPTTPNITDWLQGIGAIIASIGAIAAIIGAVAAFLSLFKKDKQKQTQIKKLSGIAEELQKQTNEFVLQSQQMVEYNIISKEILRLQYKATALNDENQKEFNELQKKALKSQNKPLFKWEGGQSSPNTISLTIKNVGGLAKITNFNDVGKMGVSVTTPIGTEVARQSIFYLTADYWGKENLNKIDVLLELFFEDSIGTKYKQTFNVRGSVADILPVEEVI